MNEYYNQAMSRLFNAGKTKPKQDPDYGRSRRLAKKIGATIEVERCYPYGSNIWISVSRELSRKEGFPLDDRMKLAEGWGHALEMLKSIEEFIAQSS
tara:strand:+ start:1163 stop:1453 length:291 start_codon:yes stop_codon:yes gene_type:complete